MSNQAPTITINGVTSKPGQPASMIHTECDCYPIIAGHGFTPGRAITCPDCQAVTWVINSMETYIF